MNRLFTLLAALALVAPLAAPAASAQQRSAPAQQAAQPDRIGDEPQAEAERAPRYRATPGTERLALTPEGLAEARAFAASKPRVTVAARPADAQRRTPRPPEIRGGATVFTVNSAFDDGVDSNPGDGFCSGPFGECQLRSAIQEANATSGPVRIEFAIGNGPTGSEVAPGVWRITLGYDGPDAGNEADVLPDIVNDNVVLDALTQPGASCGNLVAGTTHDLRVILNGSNTTGDALNANDGNGIDYTGTFSDAAFTVRGLVVQNFNFGFGIYSLTDNGLAECNYVGTDYTGESAAGNLDGIYAGGTVRNNLVSGNANHGVYARAFSSTTVSRNLVGSDDDGNQPLGNGDTGIFVSGNATDHTITTNLASANGLYGIFLGDDAFFTAGAATGADLTNNTVGLSRTRSAAAGMGNTCSGVRAEDGTSDNDIGLPGNGNYVAQNDAGNVGCSAIFVTNASNNRIRGNVLGLTLGGAAAPNLFHGIRVSDNFGTADGNVIGGSGPNDGNIVAANGGYGILLDGDTNCRIWGNTVGLNAAEVARPNGLDGIALDKSTAPIVRSNTVSGNTGSGIVLFNATNLGPTTGAVIENNRIGTNTAATAARPNGASGLVLIDATGATVTGNTISANTDTGVFLDGGTSGHTFEANFIGTNAGSADLGNGLPGGAGRAGVFCQAATDVQFGRNGTGNVVANNGADGVFLASAACQEFSIVGNVISDNGGLGIDLAPNGVTPNDPGDADSGPNGLLNFPVITSAVNDGTTVAIAWTLNARPNRTYELLFCRVPTPDPSGFGECDDPNATVRTTTNASGNASGTRTLPAARYPVGDFVTATNTRVNAAAFGGYGPTSELSRAVEVEAAATTPPLTVTITPTSPAPPVTLTRGQRVFFDITFAVGPTGPPSFQYWTEAVLPNGNTAGPLIGPNTVNVSPPATVTVSFSQRVPSNAAFGSYAYRVNAGTFPSPVLESDAFQAQVVPSASASGDDGEVSNVWLAFDADGRPAPTGAVHDFTATGEGTSADPAASRASEALPEVAALEAVYPNPARGAATVAFALPEAGLVRLAVYDVLGREVAVLADGEAEAGRHEAALRAATLPAGTYLVRLTAGAEVRTQRITVVR